MAVKVIEKGKPRDTTCGNCKSKLSYEYEDVEKTISHSYDGSSDPVFMIRCPGCAQKTYVKEWTRG